MKSRTLRTTPIIIVTNYQIEPHASGQFLHSFTPESAATPYQFIANVEPLLVSGERYNVGYELRDGINWVDISATAKANEVDPNKSFYVSRLFGEEIRAIETKKSHDRVRHAAIDGEYLGKKYAWRIYGMSLPQDAFDAYMRDTQHRHVRCFTDGTPSIAYKEEGLDGAVKALISSAIRITGNRFSSILLPSKRWFQIKGISAITDKQ
jgi:hypothetical protein